MPETKLDNPAPSAVPAVPAATAATPLPATSLRIIAAAIVFACIYYASSIVITLVCAIFIAFVLEPGVRLMERFRFPRWMGAMVMVLLMLTAVYLLIYAVYDRSLAFIHALPEYAAKIKLILANIQHTAQNIGQSTSTILPSSPESTVPTVRLQEESAWGQFLLRGIGSVYGYTVTVMFIPFLVFFMLTSQHQIWAATLNLFPLDRRQQAEDVIQGISGMVRQYVLGNVLVALISAAPICLVFSIIQLPYAALMGLLAAFLTLVPYIGVALGILPPLLIALVQYDRPAPFLWIAATVAGVHFLAVNFLTPKLVGRRVKLNPLSVTIAMMFWGWLWGGIGLVLAVPITAAIKAVCDNVRSLRPYGAWMGEG